jgi:hypothetical protein
MWRCGLTTRRGFAMSQGEDSRKDQPTAARLARLRTMPVGTYLGVWHDEGQKYKLFVYLWMRLRALSFLR